MEWMDCVKRALNERGTSVDQGRMIVCDRNECSGECMRNCDLNNPWRRI